MPRSIRRSRRLDQSLAQGVFWQGERAEAESAALAGGTVEAAIYRAVNAVLEPAIRAGLGAPLLTPAGLVVVAMTGAKSGKQRRVPLAALRIGSHLLIGTVRGESSLWVRNLAANGDVHVWLAARARPMRAFVLRPGASTRVPRALPGALHPLWRALASLTARGFAFALLAPTPPRARSPRTHRRKQPADRARVASS